MNHNVVFAVLVLKNVITEEEAQGLVEYVNERPQSTVLRDAIADVAEIIGKPAVPIMQQLGPVGPAQHAEEMAARSQTTTAGANVDVDVPTNSPAQPVAPHEPGNTIGKDLHPNTKDDKPATDKDAKPTPVKKPTDDSPKK